MGILKTTATAVRRYLPGAKPAVGIILGSGWGRVCDGFEIRKSMDFGDIPGLGAASVAGHRGKIHWAQSAGVETLIFQGRRHWYEGEGWEPVAAPVFLSKAFGASVILITNAAGGIRGDLSVGDVMVIDDHINGMGTNPLVGRHDPFWGARFPEMSRVYDAELNGWLDASAAALGQDLSHGIYLATPGPIYETPAEIRAFRSLGADAVGMSTVPEAMLAHAAGMRVAGLSCISNVTGGPAAAFSHENVVAAIEGSAPRMSALLAEFWKRLAAAGM